MSSRKDVDRLVGKLLGAAVEDGRLSCLWLEGGSVEEALHPSGPLAVHAAFEDPDLADFFRTHASFLRSAGQVLSHEDENAPNDGHLCRASFPGGIRVLLAMERRSLLAKRLRRAVVPLEDKTGGQLRHVLSFAPGHEMGI